MDKVDELNTCSNGCSIIKFLKKYALDGVLATLLTILIVYSIGGTTVIGYLVLQSIMFVFAVLINILSDYIKNKE